MKLKTRQELFDLIPRPSISDYNTLKQSIIKHGQKEPILSDQYGYVVFQMRSQRSWKRFNYNIREFMDLWSMELFPARYEYSCPEYILKKSRESQFHDEGITE